MDGGPTTASPAQNFRSLLSEEQSMKCNQHDVHNHQHNSGCGHISVIHEDHTDYLHDGHLHHVHEGHVDEHMIAQSKTNPATCTSGHDCDGHDRGHKHGPSCGHELAPHGDHSDYLVDGHLHHHHNGHCDDH